MPPAPKNAPQILKLTQDEYFSDDPSVLRKRERPLLLSNFNGIAVSAPKRVDIDRRDCLPLVLARRCNGERDWDVPLQQNCFVVGTDMHDGAVHLARAFATDRERASRRAHQEGGPRTRPNNLPVSSVAIHRFDAAELLSIQWQPGTWWLGAINYDWKARTVKTHLTSEKTQPPSPPAAREVYPAPNLNEPAGGSLPRYRLPPWLWRFTPGASQKTRFAAEHTCPEEGRASLTVHARFATTVREYHLGRGGDAAVHRLPNGKKVEVAAVVPVTFALFQLGSRAPYRYDWAVPVYCEQTLQPGMPATGQFAIDACATDPSGGPPPGTYAAYLLLDGMICGPQMVQSTTTEK